MRFLGITGLVVLLLSVGCAGAPSEPIVVSMEGTAEYFRLQCMVTQPNGSSASQSYEGTVPARYQFTGRVVSCVAQKEQAGGSRTLIMRMLRGNAVLQTSQTSEDYGVVQAAVTN